MLLDKTWPASGGGKQARSRWGARSVCAFLLVYAATKSYGRGYDGDESLCRTTYSRLSLESDAG